MQHKYVTLAEGNKHNRRSVADVIDLLITHAGFQVGDRAKIRTILMPLAVKDPVFQFCIVFPRLRTSETFLVWLPTSSRFAARATDHTRIRKYNTPDLNDASVDYCGNAALLNGMQLRAIEIVPAPLPYEFSELDRRIVMSTIYFMKIEGVVFRTLGEELDPETRASIPTIRAIDFRRLRQHLGELTLPCLKQLQGFMADSDEFIKTPSQQKISSTLLKCGMRPVERRRQC
jgi:hypothetical protein